MTSRAQDLLREALTLPINERADVAAELLASPDDAGAEDPTEVEAAWAAEIERRAGRAIAGNLTPATEPRRAITFIDRAVGSSCC